MPNPKPVCSMKKGETRNPNGRPPKGYSIADVWRSMFNEQPELKKAVAMKFIELGIKKDDITALKTLVQYMDGMPQQDITSKGEAINNNFSDDQISKIASRIASGKRSVSNSSGTK